MARRAIKHLGDVDDITEACLDVAGESGRFVTDQLTLVNSGELMR